MDKKLREKLSDPGLAQKLKEKSNKIQEKLYLKDLQFAASILEIPIDEDGTTICTEGEQLRFLALMYGILQYQIFRLKNTQNNILADIKKRNSKIAKDLIDLELSQEE